jgi:hypothetical protein
MFSPPLEFDGLVYGDGKSDPLLRGENGNGKCEGEATILKECNRLVKLREYAAARGWRIRR